MDCPWCGSGAYSKDGIVNGRQRYRCKQCHYHYTVVKKSDVKSPETRQLTRKIYLEGLGFRAIGRLLNVSHPAVLGWIKAAGKTVELPVEDKSVEVVEVDEMHTYVGQKKLPLALDCGQSFRQTFYFVCVQRPFDADGLEVMG